MSIFIYLSILYYDATARNKLLMDAELLVLVFIVTFAYFYNITLIYTCIHYLL